MCVTQKLQKHTQSINAITTQLQTNFEIIKSKFWNKKNKTNQCSTLKPISLTTGKNYDNIHASRTKTLSSRMSRYQLTRKYLPTNKTINAAVCKQFLTWPWILHLSQSTDSTFVSLSWPNRWHVGRKVRPMAHQVQSTSSITGTLYMIVAPSIASSSCFCAHDKKTESQHSIICIKTCTGIRKHMNKNTHTYIPYKDSFSMKIKTTKLASRHLMILKLQH